MALIRRRESALLPLESRFFLLLVLFELLVMRPLVVVFESRDIDVSSALLRSCDDGEPELRRRLLLRRRGVGVLMVVGGEESGEEEALLGGVCGGGVAMGGRRFLGASANLMLFLYFVGRSQAVFEQTVGAEDVMCA